MSVNPIRNLKTSLITQVYKESRILFYFLRILEVRILHAPGWDLMKKIHALKQQIPIRTVTIWVESHQDDSVLVELLSFAAQLNCQADALATSHYTCTQCNTAHNFHPPPEAEAYVVL